MIKAIFRVAIISTALTAIASAATADPITLTFEGLVNPADVPNAYASLGITLPGLQVSYGGAWQNDPTPGAAAFTTLGTPAMLNDSHGFVGALAFEYSSWLEGFSVSLYSGLNGTGANLATLNFTDTDDHIMRQVSETFVGTAMSAVFTAIHYRSDADIYLDNITLTPAATAVAEPASAAVMLSGIFGLGMAFCRLRRAGVAPA